MNSLETRYNSRDRNPEAGVSMLKALFASAILLICALGLVGLVSATIAANNRNKVDSAQTMLAESIIEQVNSTLIGVGTSSLTDCAGSTWTIETVPGGARLSSGEIDFTETDVPDDYYMNYVINSPCTSTGERQAVYDVRWHVEIVGAGTAPTNTYLITVAARMQGRGDGNQFFSLPVTLRVLAGN